MKHLEWINKFIWLSFITTIKKLGRYLPMELSGPFDLVYDKNAARKKTDDKSSALPTTPVT